MTEENKTAEIKAAYKKDDDYKIHPVTGTYDSLNPLPEKKEKKTWIWNVSSNAWQKNGGKRRLMYHP